MQIKAGGCGDADDAGERIVAADVLVRFPIENNRPDAERTARFILGLVSLPSPTPPQPYTNL